MGTCPPRLKFKFLFNNPRVRSSCLKPPPPILNTVPDLFVSDVPDIGPAPIEVYIRRAVSLPREPLLFSGRTLDGPSSRYHAGYLLASPGSTRRTLPRVPWSA